MSSAAVVIGALRVKGNATNEISYLYADPQNIGLQRSTTVFTYMNQNEEVWMVCIGDVASRIEGDHQHMGGKVRTITIRTCLDFLFLQTKYRIIPLLIPSL